jgi:V-type H+-transporting ATPase 21kDa proteolipid subunit
MSPYGYANFGVAFGLGLSIVGAAWGIWLTGSSRKSLFCPLSSDLVFGWVRLFCCDPFLTNLVSICWTLSGLPFEVVGAAVKAPRIRSKNLISVIFCEATAIYGVIMAIILTNKIKEPESGGYYLEEGWDYNGYYYAGYGMFSAGLSVGLTNIASGVSVGMAGSSCAIADAQDASLFVKILIVEIFASALGIFGIIVGIIQSNACTFPTFALSQ